MDTRYANLIQASHSENSIIQMIFAYLFFDIIFHSKKECFESPFQDRPLDFGTKYFRESRFNEIEARLTDIFNNQYHHIIETVDKQHRELETQCVGMNWKGYDFETIIEICDAIGGEKLSLICELFIDSREYSGGCPDLCLWKDGQVKFSEVKGEGDVLSAKQLTWLEFFTKNGIECEVFQVLISGKKKSRKMMLENDVDLDCIEPVVVKKMKL